MTPAIKVVAVCQQMRFQLRGCIKMKPKMRIIRCFDKKESGVWVATCLDFSLATQGDSFAEAKRKLEEQIIFYVNEAIGDAVYGHQLLNRRAPLSIWMEYYFIKIVHRLYHNVGQVFNENMPILTS